LQNYFNVIQTDFKYNFAHNKLIDGPKASRFSGIQLHKGGSFFFT